MSNIMVEAMFENNSLENNPYMKNLGKLFIDPQIKQFLNYNNYVIFSTLTNQNGAQFTIGLFGNVILMIDKERLKKTIKENENSK